MAALTLVSGNMMSVMRVKCALITAIYTKALFYMTSCTVKADSSFRQVLSLKAISLQIPVTVLERCFTLTETFTSALRKVL